MLKRLAIEQVFYHRSILHKKQIADKNNLRQALIERDD
jgi:hypothetical protein